LIISELKGYFEGFPIKKIEFCVVCHFWTTVKRLFLTDKITTNEINLPFPSLRTAKNEAGSNPEVVDLSTAGLLHCVRNDERGGFVPIIQTARTTEVPENSPKRIAEQSRCASLNYLYLCAYVSMW
jgi:hypothetical protein